MCKVSVKLEYGFDDGTSHGRFQGLTVTSSVCLQWLQTNRSSIPIEICFE